MEKMTMKDLPASERPYEKCLLCGAAALTDEELLAVIIRSGSPGETALSLAKRVLSMDSPGMGLTGLLHHSLEDFKSIKGIGLAKGAQLVCLGELSKRIWKRKTMSGARVFDNPAEIAAFYMEDLRHLEHEEIRVMFFNTRQVFLRDVVLSKGTVNTSVTSPREILIEALRCLAVSMILIHNHPSGDPTPSPADITLTRRVKEAGNLVGIVLLDHIVVGDKCYVSFREEKLL